MTEITRIGVRQALYLGERKLLAMTCRLCGELKSAESFNRRRCNNGTYVSRRCKPCTWRHAEASLGRNGTYR
jgi:RNase P subunit RPR2